MRPPRLGDALGPYQLCGEIGAGGMASVYLARIASRSGLHRFVALKCIRPEFAADSRYVEMFVDEARIATQIHHANVCNVLDFDEHHGTHYMVMELLSGQTLAAVQQQLSSSPDGDDPARPGMYARILESACEGLHAAHEAANSDGAPLNIVHRDVSPENLFITYDGNVKVVDFGVAYATEHHHATRTGFVKGKCRYLAPEVLGGNKPDRRADIWGVGVVAWELLAQRKLFDQSNDLAILRAIGEMAIPAPSTVRPGLPPVLDEIVLSALERDPAKRCPTARELGRALNRFLVEQRQIVGLAEISDLMRWLFPEGIASARQLRKLAEHRPPPSRTRATTSKERAPVADTAVALELARSTAFPEGTPPAPRSQPATKRAKSTEPPAPPAVRAPLPQVVTRWPAWSRVSMMLSIAAVVTSAVIAVAVWRLRAVEPAPPPEVWVSDPAVSNYRLEVAPAGIDASGAVLLRVQLTGRPHEPGLRDN